MLSNYTQELHLINKTIELLNTKQLNTKNKKLRKHFPLININNNYEDKVKDIFNLENKKYDMRSFSINTENYDYHKKLIINTLEMYKIQILNTLKGKLPINKQYILDITKEFKKKYNLKCVNLVYMINIMPRVSYIQVKKGTDIFKICTSYIILFGNNKINIMFDDMFTYKNYFAEINYFTLEEYNDIKNFNKNKNVNMSNIVNISNNICNPFKECSYEFDNCKIIYEYNGIDNKIKETIINNNVL